MHIYYQSKNIHVNDKPIQDRGFFSTEGRRRRGSWDGYTDVNYLQCFISLKNQKKIW